MTFIRFIPSTLSHMTDGMFVRLWSDLRALPVVEVSDARRR
jgi:hypothetical protein